MSAENPYEPPESELDNKPPQTNSVSWKTFFWITAVLMALSAFGVATMPNLNIFDYLDFLLSIIGTLGLYGFAFYKPIGSVIFWRYYFYVILIESIAISIVFPLIGIPVYGEITVFDIWYLVGSVYVIAILYALYQYSYRRPLIWQSS